jgi:hypothetical protein
MGSLALVVALMLVSFWLVAGISLFLTFVGLRLTGALFGIVSAGVGIWLLCVLPYAPFLGLINLIAGGVAILRYIRRKNGQ